MRIETKFNIGDEVRGGGKRGFIYSISIWKDKGEDAGCVLYQFDTYDTMNKRDYREDELELIRKADGDEREP